MSSKRKAEKCLGKAEKIKNIRERSVGDGVTSGLHIGQNRFHLFAAELGNLEHRNEEMLMDVGCPLHSQS